ncbi:MAG: hypothetical protein EPN46_02435 [Candidimonas sp.]|nr:MAG: hypothetical protein EPN77_05315 [Candidimonas sp.]TAM22302.1 MAG: hypothetical protein EPN62_12285 [Candidimonas sp.]TAM80190.1 MAG: hypothetical protein EPN46_02435 [Candidimonas sp.]
MTAIKHPASDGTAIYEHPDGANIRFDAIELLMTACDGTTTVNVDIGQLGMLELGHALIRIGSIQPEGVK